MLGWLMIGYPRSDWLAAQAQPRLQTYFVVALGLGVAALVTLQRVRTREREMARAAAMAATEADQLKTSFLAKVSHELRTPIQSVLGYSDLLRNVVTEPVARGRLKALRQHGELMLRLVNDLLDLSAIQAGAFRLVEKPTALVELVTQTVDSLRPRAELKGLAVALTIEPAVPSWAMIDGGRVRQVLINLVGNAIKFTDRGRVDVSLARGPGEREVTLAVSDTGPGIAAADIGRLFRSFERLDATAAKEGTGLGLALSAALCRGMNGIISVESVEGAGATFTARFRAPPCEALLASGSSAGLPPLSGRRILLADDNALVRELFTASLTEAGATCIAVEDGVLAVAAAHGENFDAIVLDLAMPRLGGVEAAKKLRAEHGRDLRIVGLSAHAGRNEREDALGAGMDAFLVKPVNLDELVAALAPAVPAKHTVETGRMELIERLRAQFRLAAAAEGAALGAVIAGRDHATARARAHHLMNSAAVVRDDWLFAACASVERAAVAGDEAALITAWQTCEAALEPWTHPARHPTNSVGPAVENISAN
jgi:signal transduction histidine kinase/CheY-like chemotaxis protein